MSSNLESFRIATVLSGTVLIVALAGPGNAADAICGDVNTSGDVTTSDALNVLRRAVGQEVPGMFCGLETRFGDFDDYNETPIIPQNHLLGQLINVPRQSVITHYGIITRQGGVQSRMALYTDDNGSPGTLVSGTLQVELVLGAQKVPAAMQKGIAPGNYWLMANFGGTAEVAGDENAGESAIIKFREQSVTGNPGEFGPAQQYTGQRLNYWIEVLN
jgi:hypothetical protein